MKNKQEKEFLLTFFSAKIIEQQNLLVFKKHRDIFLFKCSPEIIKTDTSDNV